MTTFNAKKHFSFADVKAAAANDLWWKRSGLVGWWLNLTAPPRPANMGTYRAREYIRRAELVSFMLISYFFYETAIIFNSAGYVRGGMIQTVMVLVITLLAILNRRGYVRSAAYGSVLAVMLADIFSIVLSTKGLSLIWFPAYDLLALPIFASSLIIHRHASLYFALGAALFIAADFFLQPHGLREGMGAHDFNDIAYAMAQPYQNWWTMINRHVVLVLFSGIFGWLAALSFEKALHWTEQATHEADQAKILKQHAELLALQSQINPHFLYNTLSTMQMMALSDGNEQLASMTYTLGQLMHYALESQDMVDVQREITHVEHYLLLMKQRYGSRLLYCIDVAEELLSLSIPKLTLQPLIENAITHGIAPKIDAGCILISGWREEQEAVLEISDTGVGISAPRLHQLQFLLQAQTPLSEGPQHIGIRNIQARLQSVFGRAYGLSLEPGETAGTRVTIRLPLSGQRG